MCIRDRLEGIAGALGDQQAAHRAAIGDLAHASAAAPLLWGCLLYTSDAAAARSSVDLGGRRVI